jgi:hypothetical protein
VSNCDWLLGESKTYGATNTILGGESFFRLIPGSSAGLEILLLIFSLLSLLFHHHHHFYLIGNSCVSIGSVMSNILSKAAFSREQLLTDKQQQKSFSRNNTNTEQAIRPRASMRRHRRPVNCSKAIQASNSSSISSSSCNRKSSTSRGNRDETSTCSECPIVPSSSYLSADRNTPPTASTATTTDDAFQCSSIKQVIHQISEACTNINIPLLQALFVLNKVIQLQRSQTPLLIWNETFINIFLLASYGT